MKLHVQVFTALACLVLVGCLGGDDSTEQIVPNEPATNCPNGEEQRSVSYDLGTDNPNGEPTPRGAIARFLDFERAPLNVESFERIAISKSGTQATFVLNDGEFELVRLFLERFDRGWLVVGYYYCKGEI